MGRPWDISGDDLNLWAHRVGASEKLPSLVRRLLFATTPRMTRIEMRADGGTRLGGWDGIVQAAEATAHCPAGLSVWELSVEHDVKRKLDEDFEKRTANPGDVDPKRVTYVAVTTRRMAKDKPESKKKKATWRKEKSAKRKWAEVLLYDADDLSMWLEQAPAVARWFAAEELARPVDDIYTVEDFLLRFSQRTRPPLPVDLVLTGEDRTTQARMLLDGLVQTDEYLQQLPIRPTYHVHSWRISAEWSEEAWLFVAAALSTSTPEAEHLRARTLIVESMEAFHYCLRSDGHAPLLILPRFDRVLPMQTAARRVQMVLPAPWRERIKPGEGLRLDPIPFHPLARALEVVGFEDTKRLARNADGRISKLLWLMGGSEPPKHGPSDSMTERAALLLVGAWMPTREADRAVVKKLGADPEKAERLSVALSNGEDPAMEAHEYFGGARVFRWVAPRAAWKAHAPELTDSDMNRFFDVALEVLTPAPPRPEQDERARIRASVERTHAGCSGALMSGLSQSIAWLAVVDDEGYLEPTHPPGRGSDLARALVRELLLPEGHVWSSLSDALRDMAEAAPQQFLHQLSDALEGNADDVAALSNSVNLLWALESLAWNAHLLPQVVLALARMAAHDTSPENIANRPINSLKHVLHPAMPQSQSSARDRVEAFRLLFDQYEDMAWQVCTNLLHELDGSGLIVPTPRPKYRRWVNEDERRHATPSEYEDQIDAMITLLLERAGEDPARWASLVSLPHISIGWRLLDALREAFPQLVKKDKEAVLWDAVRGELGRAASSIEREGDDAAKEVPSDLLEWWKRLDVLHDDYVPPDLVLRYRWLFDGYDQLPKPVPGGYEANEKHWLNLQHEAVEAIWERADRWKLLGRLAKAVKSPYLLGRALGSASYAAATENALFADPPEVDLGESLKYFWASRLYQQGWDWFQQLLTLLVERGRSDEAVSVALLFRGTPELWDLVDRLGETVRNAYWKKHEPLWLEHLSAEAYEHGISLLLEADRAESAAEAAYQGIRYDRLTANTLLRILEALRGEEQQGRKIKLKTYQIEPLFLALDRHTDLDEERIIALEIAHAERLHEPGFAAREPKRGARCFYEKVKRSPDFFVEVLRHLHDSRRESMDTLDEPKDRAGFRQKHLSTLLYYWRGHPGEGLAIPEREVLLQQWCKNVLEKATKAGFRSFAVHHVEIILTRVDVDEDGHWPCLAARRLLESGAIGSLSTAKFNSRGWKTRSLGEGGNQERELASTYQAGANALRSKYPRTASMLESMAKCHIRDAERDDAEARREHIEYGEDDRPAPRGSAASAPGTITDSHLTRIEIRGVGPAPEIRLDLGPRLNLLTGDNSLGKTFVLEIVWWVLTGSWTEHPAKPEQKQTKAGKIAKTKAAIVATAGGHSLDGKYNAIHERWSTQIGGPLAPGLVVYARGDGGFSIWDPIRNVAPISKGEFDLSGGYHFKPEELWRGKVAEDKATVLCRGLLEDVVSWHADPERRADHSMLERVLTRIFPSEEPIRLGPPARFKIRDARDVPTLQLPYGKIPAEHASAAVKRMLALAYALVWAVAEIQKAAAFTALDPLRHVTLLIDEIEAHLHPKWQRSILRALLGLAEDLAPQAKVQFVVTTHAPLVLVSLEELLDESTDVRFDFDLEPVQGTSGTKKVVVVERKRGSCPS